MEILVNILLLITITISAVKATITTTYTVDMPYPIWSINQIGTSSKAWALDGPNLMIFDFVHPNGGFSAPALDQIILPPSPGDWDGSFIRADYYNSNDIIIIPAFSKTVSVNIKSVTVIKTYTSAVYFHDCFGAIRGSNIFIMAQFGKRFYRYFIDISDGFVGAG